MRRRCGSVHRAGCEGRRFQCRPRVSFVIFKDERMEVVASGSVSGKRSSLPEAQRTRPPLVPIQRLP